MLIESCSVNKGLNLIIHKDFLVEFIFKVSPKSGWVFLIFAYGACHQKW